MQPSEVTLAERMEAGFLFVLLLRTLLLRRNCCYPHVSFLLLAVVIHLVGDGVRGTMLIFPKAHFVYVPAFVCVRLCSARKVLEEIRSKGLEPDVTSFNIAVHACAVGCQWQVGDFGLVLSCSEGLVVVAVVLPT